MTLRLSTILAAALATLAVLLVPEPSGACAGPCPSESATAEGTRFADLDADGVRDPGEPGQAGIVVYVDIDGNKRRGGAEPHATTGDDGRYTIAFDPLDHAQLPGDAAVRTDEPAGSRCTAPAPCEHVRTWQDGAKHTGLDFAGAARAIVRGVVYDDRDSSADRKTGWGEPGREGEVVYLDEDIDGARDAGEPFTTTDGGGAYALAVEPKPGYTLGRVRVDLKDGVGCPAPKGCVHRLDLSQTTTVTDADFALYEPAVVFLHGFLGSEIACNGDELWPNMPEGTRLADMRLSDDGATNLSRAEGGDACTESAAVTGKLVEKVLGFEDIYGSSVRGWGAMMSNPHRAHFYAWDWRKSPELALAGLDRLIDRIRAEQHVEKVVIASHSFGGLLMRWYLEDPARAAKVVRAVSMGTPYWGSPKAIFPLAAGVEAPMFSGMDLFLDNEELKEFAANLQGGYFLYPTPKYGPWLGVEGRGRGSLDPSGVSAYVGELEGNPVLLGRAQNAHASILDHFHTSGVDYQVVIGEGVTTVQTVRFLPAPDPADSQVELRFGNGDGTVPAHSAAHDTPAARLHKTCGISHVPLPGHPQVLDGLRDWVLSGEKPKLPGGCADGGVELEIHDVDMSRAPRVRAAQAAGSVSLAQAERQGLVQVVRSGRQTIVVTSDRAPVTLDLGKGRKAVTATRLEAGRRGTTKSYGIVSGATISTAGPDVAVRRGGKAVTPRKLDTKAPVTTVKLVRKGKAYRLTAKAEDATGVAVTRLRIGKAKPKALRGALTLTKAQLRRGVRVHSVDALGNVERERKVKAPR